jgi:hypothetical protein
MNSKVSRFEAADSSAGALAEHTQLDLLLQFRLSALTAHSIPSMQEAIQRTVDVALSKFAVDQQVINDADKMAQLLVGNATPNMVLVEERVGRLKTINKIVGGGEFFTGADINEHSASPKLNKNAVASDWKRRGRIFSITHGGVDIYPAYQFDLNFKPLPIIRDVLSELKENDPWAIASWFHFPNDWITERRGVTFVAIAPKDALKDRPDDVLAAARKEQGTYSA